LAGIDSDRVMKAGMDTYGKIIRQYAGEGELLSADGHKFDGKFEVAQTCSGRLVGLFYPDASIGTGVNMIDRTRRYGFIDYTLTGSTNDSFGLEAKVYVVGHKPWPDVSRGPADTLTLSGRELLLHSKSPKSRIEEYHFGLTNLEFTGCESSILESGGRARDKTTMDLSGLHVTLRQLPDYKLILKELIKKGGIDVTAEAIVRVTKKHDPDELSSILDDVCLLLSFARGTYMSWVYRDAFDKGGRLIASFSRNGYTKPFHGTEPLIDSTKNPEDLRYFLETCCGAYREAKDVLGLKLSLEYYIEAKSLVLMEPKYLTAFLPLEVLSSRYPERRIILTKKEFKTVRVEVAKLIQSLSLNKGKTSQLTKNISALNNIPIRQSLKGLFENLSVRLTDAELGRLIRLRNKIVHEGIWGDDEPSHYPDYKKLVSILDRTLLKILGYDGYFLDCLNGFRRSKL